MNDTHTRHAAETAPPLQLLYSVVDAAKQLGVGRTKLKQLIAEGHIKQVKIGDRALVAASELSRYVAALVAAA